MGLFKSKKITSATLGLEAKIAPTYNFFFFGSGGSFEPPNYNIAPLGPKLLMS